MDFKTIITDVLVIGGGLAGLCASIAAKLRGAEVTLVSKYELGRPSSTFFSVGAFRVITNQYKVNDFIRDTFESGRYINNSKLVEVLAKESIDALHKLKQLGLRFKIYGSTAYVLTHEKITKGASIIKELTETAKTFGIKMVPYAMTLDITSYDEYWVVPIWCWKEDKVLLTVAKAVIIATGGIAGIYQRTTNPPGNIGDGHVLALKAGAKLIDMEFIQFFPFALAEYGVYSFLIPVIEGRIFNDKGENILIKHNITSISKAIERSRDLLSRIMMKEILSSSKDYVLLYVDLDEENVAKELTSHLNIQQPLKVAPAAHFSMGGVLADVHGHTDVPGLFVAGEIMGGIHGANRLASNALTAATVFGFRAGNKATEFIHDIHISIDKFSFQDIVRRVKEILSRCSGTINPQKLRAKLSKYMWLYLGPLRSRDSIQKVKEIIEYIKLERHKIMISTKRDLLNKLELENSLIIATLLAESAYLRRESRGAHFRLDYPEEIRDFVNVITVTKLTKKGKIEVFTARRNSVFGRINGLDNK